MDNPTAPRSRRWWSPGLAVHAGLVVGLVVVHALPSSWVPDAVSVVAAAVGLLLGLPWTMMANLAAVVPGSLGRVVWSLVEAVPLLLNLGIHAAVLTSVRRRHQPPSPTGSVSCRPAGRPWPVLAASTVAGAATWGGWLGWDHSASYDVVTSSVQSPYVTLQVLGCALTVGLVTALIAARWRPVAAAAGVWLGFWLCWTIDAGLQDDTGLYLVGAMLLAVGLAAGTALAAATGRGVHWVVDVARARRSR